MIDVLAKIDQLRKERDWTIYRLADEALINQSTLANMFARKTMPSLYTLSMICDAFGITMSEFFDEKLTVNDETKLLSAYRQLCDKDRNTVYALAKHLLKHSK